LFFGFNDMGPLGNSVIMPRAHRLKVAGGLFHLTRRCHNRAFLLRFARDRDAYRAKLRQKLKHFDVSLLDYCLTCNHVHHEIMGTRGQTALRRSSHWWARQGARGVTSLKARDSAPPGNEFVSVTNRFVGCAPTSTQRDHGPLSIRSRDCTV
jgi:hypothetical protein